MTFTAVARRLPLPVRVAIRVRLVWRRVGAVAAVQRRRARAGRGWVPPLQGSEQALAKRLDPLPAAALGELFAEGCARLQAQPLPTWPGLEDWAQGRAHFAQRARLAGATRAALRNKTQAGQRVDGRAGAGRTMVRGEACSQRSLWPLSTPRRPPLTAFAPQILAAVPGGGLGVCAWGFCSFRWGEDCTEQQQCFVTRLRHQTADRTLEVVRHGPSSRAALLKGGQ